MFKFQYPEVVYNHYSYCDAVDKHNGRRMFPIAIEEQRRKLVSDLGVCHECHQEILLG